jgi:DinB family protein
MSLPKPVETLWNELQAVRVEVLSETEGLTQRQADWKPSAKDWSIGEIIDHLTIAEIATGKLTTKLTKEAAAAGTLAPWPADLRALAPLPPDPPGPADAPQVVQPGHGKAIGELITTMRATRERSRQSVEKLATVDPRKLRFKHFRLGDLDLAQWWQLQARHDGIHLAQVRDVRRAPGFPKA